MDDLLWPHFLPLWRDLAAASSTRILVAGGYGLFLKQRWLSNSASLPTVVPIENWLDATPRVTKDVDLVLGLDLIKDASHQKSVVSALAQNGFEASDRAHEQRWKFLKRLPGDQLIVVEMHAQDVYRVVAMMTMEERDRASEVVEAIVGTDTFAKAKNCWQNDFANARIPVVRELGGKWRDGDAATNRGVLSGWFA